MNAGAVYERTLAPPLSHGNLQFLQVERSMRTSHSLADGTGEVTSGKSTATCASRAVIFPMRRCGSSAPR